MSFKNIRIKMKNGKSRLQRVKVLASGKFKFVKNIKSPLRSTKKTKTTKKRGTTSKGSHHMGRRQSVFQTVKKISLVGAIAAPGLGVALRKDIGWPEKIGAVSEKYFAYNTHRGTFEPGRLIEGYGPYITTKLVHKMIAALNKLIQGI